MYDSGLCKEESEGRNNDGSEVKGDNECGEREREVEMNKFNRRVTRIQGAVVDQPWVMPRTIEHEKKGRPQH